MQSVLRGNTGATGAGPRSAGLVRRSHGVAVGEPQVLRIPAWPRVPASARIISAASTRNREEPKCVTGSLVLTVWD